MELKYLRTIPGSAEFSTKILVYKRPKSWNEDEFLKILAENHIHVCLWGQDPETVWVETYA